MRLFLSVRFALVLCTSVRWVSAPSHAVSAAVSRLGQALITVQAAVFLKGVVGIVDVSPAEVQRRGGRDGS